MPYPTKSLLILAIFLVPNSQAVISNSAEASKNTRGYFCEIPGKTMSVNIHYGDSPSNLPCRVTIEGSNTQAISLIEAKRNTSLCEHKAETMKQRLVDRGWHCLSSGI